jgi:hypothetical protein
MTAGHWAALDRRMNTGRLYHDIADLIYDSPGFIGSVCRSRAVAVEIMDLIAKADRSRMVETNKDSAPCEARERRSRSDLPELMGFAHRPPRMHLSVEQRRQASLRRHEGRERAERRSLGAHGRCGCVLSRAVERAGRPHRLENPIMLGHPKRLFGIPDPTQIIQPWQFGHGETKATCLWLKGLPPLVANEHRRGPRAARVPHGAWTGSQEGPQPHLRRHC